jgi:hypothetical protein
MAADDEVSDPENWQNAFDSGAELRRSLEKVTQDRREQNERTSIRLGEMSAQLSAMMDAIREQTGMPPVATPPDSAAKKAAAAVAASRAAAAAAKGTSSTSTGESAMSSSSIGGSDSDVDPYMDMDNLGYDSAAGWQVLASENQLPVVDDAGVKFRIECDKDGCSLIEIHSDAPAGAGVRSQYLQSGPGFRVGYDPEGSKSFCGTIGSEHWLLALSRDEIVHFKRLSLALQKKMDRISRGLDEAPELKLSVRRSGDGMFNERVGRMGSDCSVELESKLLWVQAFGSPDLGQYGIRAIFMEGRQSECFWRPSVIPAMLAAVAKLQC